LKKNFSGKKEHVGTEFTEYLSIIVAIIVISNASCGCLFEIKLLLFSFHGFSFKTQY